jgi:hypothetical protein
MISEKNHPCTLQMMIAAGEVKPPAERGMPDLIPELAADVESLADLVIADRDRERDP